MVAAIGEDVNAEGYEAIIRLTRKLNAMYSTPREVQVATVAILSSLLPSWLPALHKILIAGLVPSLACKLNALATWYTCQWLMGPSKINGVETDKGEVEEGHGVYVERCRYLEEAGCVSVCVNSCKVPTQEFFATKMGLTVTLTPNYENYSCQFSFGKTPSPPDADLAFQSPCFSHCPSRLRAGIIPKEVESVTGGAERCHRV
ncbi:hypothetical protein CEUSTIGMA_g3014.t1 [Chlamydomonas eustigma]|uniref:Beta-carotene isomerase D27-like C-terminal domain-containing protein n=1 Tax=Chlamydomonas eustigma TaxID=1157962 RepID=A0A250WXM8_9CHLO|nr:hypothetical protein CEUSTIGMA_g3014.t1 [Chlamydomonas eustigma]|eukprot:GAX75571.1 hypothetical protein CEUSTIGMA_g3014.t1 [Chlamydomonas eustigma]